MIGTLIGLINMLKNLDGADMNSLGPDMAVALITTFYGSLLAHVVFNPIAANLTARDEEEILCRQIIMEGSWPSNLVRIPSSCGAAADLYE